MTPSEVTPDITGELKQWHRVTLDFEGPDASENRSTFYDTRMDVTFTSAKTGEKITVPGYFAADGDAADSGATSGNIWRVNFNPPDTGEWSYEVSFRTGKNVATSLNPNDGTASGFDGSSGTFSIAASNKSGDDLRSKGMLEYDGDQYLSFAGDGSTFLKSGVGSPENFLGYSGFDNTPDSHDYAPHLSDFNAGDPTWDGGQGKGIIGAVNYLAEQNVNSMYMMLMNVGGDGRDVWPWADTDLDSIKKSIGTADGSFNLTTGANAFDVSKLDQWEIVFSHMEELGITLHLFFQETENDFLLNDGELGVERAAFMREMVARFGHHNGVIWNLGEENTNTAGQLRDHSEYLKAIDPYDHPVALHTYPGDHDTYEDFHGEETLDVLSFQTAGDSHMPDLDRYQGGAEQEGRPVVAFLDEPGSAAVGLAAEGDLGWKNNHENMRETLWQFYTEGGSGVEWYFGYQTDNGKGGDLAIEDFSSRESAYQWSAVARSFFEALPLDEMTEADGLTSGTKGGDHVIAKRGEVYAIYLPEGGSANLNLSGFNGKFSVLWFDPRNGGSLQDGTVTEVDGGGTVSLGLPPNNTNQDWTILVHSEGIITPEPLPPADEPANEEPEPEPEPQPQGDLDLFLIDPATDKRMLLLSDGDKIDPELLTEGRYSIEAVPRMSGVESVRLSVEGHTQVENVSPYSLFNDVNSNFLGQPLGDEPITVTAEAFSADGARGTLLATTTTTFERGENVNTGGPTYKAKNGLVVMEVEDGIFANKNDAGNNDWKLEKKIDGYTGDGYLRWDGPNLLNPSKAGSGTLKYKFSVDQKGEYFVTLHATRPKNDEKNDANNDFWARVDGGPWQKVFFGGPREEWNWARTFDVKHVKSPFAYDLSKGEHVLEISGRSHEAMLDRIHINLDKRNMEIDEPVSKTTDGGNQDPGPQPDPTPDPAPAPKPAPNGDLVEVFVANTTTDKTITKLTDGKVLKTIDGKKVTLYAESTGEADIGSVKLSAPGIGTKTENVEPYALFGDSNGDFLGGVEIEPGNHVVNVTAYAGANGTGKILDEFAIDFSVPGSVPINRVPLPKDDTASATAGKKKVINVLANDTDPDGDAMTIDLFSDPSKGVAEIINNKVHYTPNAKAKGTDTFEYVAIDSEGGKSAPAQVTVSIGASQPSADTLQFFLVDTATDKVLTEVEDNDTIAFSVVKGRKVSIMAEAEQGAPDIGSVELEYRNQTRIENVEPYALFGDQNGDFMGGKQFAKGSSHSVSVDVFANKGGNGALLDEIELDFQIG